MDPSLFLLLFILSTISSSVQSTGSGFTISLIHRDSPLSPYHNSANTYYQNLHNALHRSTSRSSPIQSPLTVDHLGMDYLIKISVGTPPRSFLAVADTGSDMVWIQCKPCLDCYNQHTPLYNPKKSSTYKKQPCNSQACRTLWPPACPDKNTCSYMASYRDRSYSSGLLSWDSFTFESTSAMAVVFPNISIGCGNLNRGTFDIFTAGIVGLGNSDHSLPNQLSAYVNRKFAYCMVPLRYNVSSKISFGSNAVVSGSGVQITPYFTRDADPFYYLNLESVSIGVTNIKFDSKTYSKNADENDGNIAIDSGTTLTFFPSEFYEMIEDEFKRIISSTPVKGEHNLRLCYKNDESFEEKVPTVTFHFTGAKWELGVSNTMVALEDGTICLSMTPGSLAIFGNLQQMDYLVGYDLNGKTLSFVKTDCAKQ